ncbi:hypothetical protein NXH18_25855, partial [Klebsiella pneumoniae]|nr:hypothetical protein [Klebsiella pneumoniae]MDS7582527.1 hypothetical protein [Klebsiella pneumoniae]MDS7659551.1 hypothetical protein [Klebsiella pneumoniae]MDS7664854.1 hypothetical protein [Klebsiella pneumoniae]
MKKLLELRQQKAALKTQMRSMLEKADSEKRSLNDEEGKQGNDSNLLIVFYVQIVPDDFVMQLHR